MSEKRQRPRRGRGEGSIEELPSGKFRVVISLGKDANGKRVKLTETFDTKKQALAWINDRQAEHAKGTLAQAGKLTLGEWLDRWLASRKGDIEPTSWHQYEQHVRVHLKPNLGDLLLGALRPLHVRDLYTKLEAGGMSAAMRAKVATTLRTALKEAVALQLLAVNHALAVKKPKRLRKVEANPWDAEQARRFLEAARKDRLYAMYAVALDSGMRQGELFGLHWTEVDFAGGCVRVVRSLQERHGDIRLKAAKTKQNWRRIGLPDVTMRTLEWHRRAMKRAGFDVEAGPVFVDRDGGWLRKSNVHRRSFVKIVGAAKLPLRRFHDLRHTHATLLLMNGVNIKAVSARLGHASAQITLDLHTHFMPETDGQIGAVVNAVLHPNGFVPPQSHKPTRKK